MAKHTRFPGSNEPLHIFQDNTFENIAPMTSHAPMPAVTKPNRRPLASSNSNSNANIVLAPPMLPHATYSPFKPRPNSHSSSHAPLSSSHGNKLNTVAMAPPAGKGHSTDSLYKKPFLTKFKTAPQRPLMDPRGYEKENLPPRGYAPAISSDENYLQKPNGKRGLMEAAPIKGMRPAKKIKIEPSGFTNTSPMLRQSSLPQLDALPSPLNFPRIVDDGAKPPHSYAQLIGMAILRSPMHRLTLAQIYKWISDNYSFYNPTDAGWQNSIRHNLSLHKNFIKVERPKDDPGKGNYWAIEKGTESQFLKEKTTRKSAPTGENLPVMSTRLEPSRPTRAPLREPTLPPPIPVSQANLPPLPTSQASMSMPAEVSSDATIPVSDNAGPEDVSDHRHGNNDISLDSSLYSPLPAVMPSSPPVSRHMDPRSNTPPPMFRNPASSINRSHKRKFASMDDSGYISSLESSAMRPNQKAGLLTSEPERRLKRGRAEEEIMRLRNSSPFPSPTKARSHSVYGPVSSSPLRQVRDHHMLPPLTPVVKLKPPSPLPPNFSPATSLRIHRNNVQHILQSPLHRAETVQWSPAFNLDSPVYNHYDCDVLNSVDINSCDDFSIFNDISGLDDNMFVTSSSADTGSPVKRSAKRARLDRSVSTSALGEITNRATKRAITSAPMLKVPEMSPAHFLESPSKAFEDLSSPAKRYHHSPSKFANFLEVPTLGNWSGLVLDPADFIPSNNNTSSMFTGLDIMQGFGKIGDASQPASQEAPQDASQAAPQQAPQQPRLPRGGKPGLGRSYSSIY
ncbi:hypothetical protein G7046_g8154 [Stylonectria norvegica]|nr:hypothetical protein G7046_g8154 [Stylonectria norvegica]